VRALTIACLLCAVTQVARADDWPLPEPVGFHGRGFEYVAEIFPPESRQNIGKKPLCYMYRVGYPGAGWKVDAKLVWKAELATMPYEAVVTMDGLLVTLDQHGNVGFDHAVDVYDARGKLVRSLKLDELFAADDLDKIEHSVSSRWWRRGAKVHVIAGKLYITVASGKTVEVALKDGAPRKNATLPVADSNAITEVWKLNLRFASITDVLAAGKR
jgi:hypothetical protein